jgi:hypothetical protein
MEMRTVVDKYVANEIIGESLGYTPHTPWTEEYKAWRDANGQVWEAFYEDLNALVPIWCMLQVEPEFIIDHPVVSGGSNFYCSLKGLIDYSTGARKVIASSDWQEDMQAAACIATANCFMEKRMKQ